MSTTQRDPLAILILAAGQSQRMGQDNKLCHPFQNKPLLQHSLDAFYQAAIAPCFVVTGHDAPAITSLAKGCDMQCLYNPDHHKGMGSSIAYGVRQLAQSYDHIMIALGDMPFVLPAHITALCQAHFALAAPQERISRPLYGGTLGHPVIWGHCFFEALGQLDADIGAQSLITEPACHLVPIAIDSNAPHPAIDFDRPDDFLMR